MCLVEGEEEFKLVSAVFKQNLYSGVYDDLLPSEIPEDIDFFNVNKDKYPLLAQIEKHILATKLKKGDCLYVPAFYWVQTRSHSEQSMFLTFGYESHSRLTDLLFDAINDGILERD